APVIAECMRDQQALVDPGNADAWDACGDAYLISRPAEDWYPLGTTSVSYTAADIAGNQDSCTSTVTVQDTTPPAITCPGDIVAQCTGSSSAKATPGIATATDGCSPVTIAGPKAVETT